MVVWGISLSCCSVKVKGLPDRLVISSVLAVAVAVVVVVSIIAIIVHAKMELSFVGIRSSHAIYDTCHAFKPF